MTFKQERPEKVFSVQETPQVLDYWLHRPHVSDELRAELAGTHVLLVPDETFREKKGPFFPEGTSSLLGYLQDNLPTLKVDICADDASYRELALHFDLVNLGQFVVELIGAPLFVVWLQEHLDQRVNVEQVEVKCSVTVQQNPDGGRAFRMDYSGPASELRDTIEPMLRDIAQALAATPSEPAAQPLPEPGAPALPPAGSSSGDSAERVDASTD